MNIAVVNAIVNENLEALSASLGNDINQVITSGPGEVATPLIVAIQFKKYKIVEYLLDKGASVTIPNGLFLLEASLDENFPYSLLQRMIEMGANVNITNMAGFSPLFNVAYDGDYDKIKLLLENGADVNLANRYNVTPVMNLVGSPNFNYKSLALFIEYGAKTNIVDKDGETMLNYAKKNPVIANNKAYMSVIEKIVNDSQFHHIDYKQFTMISKILGINIETDKSEPTLSDFFVGWWNSHYISEIYNEVVTKFKLHQKMVGIRGFSLLNPTKEIVIKTIFTISENKLTDAFKIVRDSMYQLNAIDPLDLYLMSCILALGNQWEHAEKIALFNASAVGLTAPTSKTVLESDTMFKPGWMVQNEKLVNYIADLLLSLKKDHLSTQSLIY